MPCNTDDRSIRSYNPSKLLCFGLNFVRCLDILPPEIHMNIISYFPQLFMLQQCKLSNWKMYFFAGFDYFGIFGGTWVRTCHRRDQGTCLSNIGDFLSLKLLCSYISNDFFSCSFEFDVIFWITVVLTRMFSLVIDIVWFSIHWFWWEGPGKQCQKEISESCGSSEW